MISIKTSLFTLLCCFICFSGVAQTEFITTWQTTSDGESITIPTTGTGYNYTVDWGDGSATDTWTGDATHTYTTAGTHTVQITGTFPRIYFNNGGDKDNILTVEQWGTIAWTSMAGAFQGCVNLVINATDAPNLAGCTSIQDMFAGCLVLVGGVEHWNVSTITNMNGVFNTSEHMAKIKHITHVPSS